MLNSCLLPDGIEDVPLEAIACRGDGPCEQQVEEAMLLYRRHGLIRPLLIDEAGQIVTGQDRLEAARRLRLSSVPVLRTSGLTLRQRQLHELAERAGLSVNGPCPPETSIATLNASGRTFWAGKRDIVASILRDQGHNERFETLRRAQSGEVHPTPALRV